MALLLPTEKQKNQEQESDIKQRTSLTKIVSNFRGKLSWILTAETMSADKITRKHMKDRCLFLRQQSMIPRMFLHFYIQWLDIWKSRPRFCKSLTFGVPTVLLFEPKNNTPNCFQNKKLSGTRQESLDWRHQINSSFHQISSKWEKPYHPNKDRNLLHSGLDKRLIP